MQIRLYENLFINENPDTAEEGKDFTTNLNPESLEILSSCKLEPCLANAKPESRYQFERLGYFCVDSDRTSDGKLIFNRTATLRDTWAKIQKAEGQTTQ